MFSLIKGSKLTVQVPSSIANFGPGFDVFALALSHPHDLVTVERLPEKKISLQISGLNANSIPLEVAKNTASLVAKIFIQKFDLTMGFKIRIEKGIQHSCGLGSSGADAAATAYAINCLLDLGLSENKLIALAALGEVASSGFPHADNVAAAMLGGFTIIRSYKPIDVYRLEPPENLGVCIAIPKIPVPPRKTAEARKILPENVTLDQLIHNVGHAAALTYGMATKDVSLIGLAMNDLVVEPVRAQLIPAYETVKARALEQGAVGVTLCGAGPSMAAFFDSEKDDLQRILGALEEGFQVTGVDTKTFVTAPGKGIQIV